MQDSIMKVVPVPYETTVPIHDQKRYFYVIPKRGGIFMVTSLTE
jgi:hypothetical protein